MRCRIQLTDSILEQLRGFDSATISNATEQLNLRDKTEGYASRELRCLFPELKPMVGYAVTCVADSTSPGTKRPGKLNDLFALVANLGHPSVVVIQNSGPDPLRSCFVGDMSSAVYQRLGAVGLVTDGGVRDVSGIRTKVPGFQIFSPGAVVSHGNATIIDVNIPVRISGLAINPGDLLHGDESGLLHVPGAWIESILEKATLVRKTEQEWFDYVHSDLFTLEGLKRFVH
jgi:4-hydroxy-4-methyl-2-oxoglutarate aldolase